VPVHRCVLAYNISRRLIKRIEILKVASIVLQFNCRTTVRLNRSDVQ
jgi:hypothetical protein